MRDSTLAPVWFQMAQVFRRGWEHRGTQGLPCRGLQSMSGLQPLSLMVIQLPLEE